ncbi:hypothetical protein ACSVH2_13185 [Flavobacterium sp. RSB2_4_14]|uniref:hypothetical protein n=1 Tax=Flavobacterium sp. RSB2_4_14 TaxID=3447665 RepID=UPI003F3C27AF
MDSEQIRKRIWLITDGVPLSIENVTIRIDRAGKLLVIGWTNTFYLENVTKVKSFLELENLKQYFMSLKSQFEEFDSLISLNNLTTEYHITFNEGKNAIGICSEINGELNWYL